MTVREAVDKAGMLYPNVFPFAEKASWLRELDRQIYAEFLSRYEDSAVYSPSEEYTADTCLYIGEPFTDIYISYIAMKLDIYNSDIERYRNSCTLFNNSYRNFTDYYNRNHTIAPVSVKIE